MAVWETPEVIPGLMPAMLDFAAAQCGLSGFPQQLNKALQVIPTKVDSYLKEAVKFLVGKVKSLLRVAPGGATPLATKVPFRDQA